ncbi:ATP-binding cassette domain-containing protein [Alloyangia mangrovi]|uniref:ATP-binding cassette domain-containing protein n=1 Tax=Alloyangia mangrovi TaxID=1779329 RepID=UPI0021A43A1B|nr:ATP-binding cassette domain-containing protein [Alloyangia mangrovi]
MNDHRVSRMPILSLKDIGKHYGGVTALSGVSFDVAPGEVVALAGDNGAGKSTMIKIISGIIAADEGQILFDGKPATMSAPQDANDLGIQTVYQDLALCDNLDTVQNLFLGRELSGGVAQLFPPVAAPDGKTGP